TTPEQPTPTPEQPTTTPEQPTPTPEQPTPTPEQPTDNSNTGSPTRTPSPTVASSTPFDSISGSIVSTQADGQLVKDVVVTAYTTIDGKPTIVSVTSKITGITGRPTVDYSGAVSLSTSLVILTSAVFVSCFTLLL
ncbi:hypothetical protein K7432_017147, partial [Basidiobolus ranarum]